MTLNTAYKKVFGELLEPLGFKSIMRQPYFVRVIDGEILHVIALRKEAMMIKGKTDFSILSGVETVYRKQIDFSSSPINHLNWLKPIIAFVVKGETYVKGEADTTSKFRYDNHDDASLNTALITAQDAIMKFILPQFSRIISLETFVDYLYEFNISPSLCYNISNLSADDFDDELLQVKIENAESLFLREEKYGLARLEGLKRLVDGHGEVKVSAERYAIEKEKYIADRQKRYENCNQLFSDTEWINNALSVLELRKRTNTEYLNKIGLL